MYVYISVFVHLRWNWSQDGSWKSSSLFGQTIFTINDQFVVVLMMYDYDESLDILKNKFL